MINVCPICKKDRSSKEAYNAIVKFLIDNECTVNLMNPGGREFYFKSIGRVQISDMCHWCDINKLEEIKSQS